MLSLNIIVICILSIYAFWNGNKISSKQVMSHLYCMELTHYYICTSKIPLKYCFGSKCVAAIKSLHPLGHKFVPELQYDVSTQECTHRSN